MKYSKIPLVVIVGPTASGKSDLAIVLARKLHGEIISADSRQVYRGMDIATGKVTKREQRLVPHHLLNVADSSRTFTVARYQKLATKAIADITKRHKLPIIVGGTGFYIDALVYQSALPKVKPNNKLRAKLEKQTAEQLFKQLQKLDPTRAHNIDQHNKRRLIRALEIIYSTGAPISPVFPILNTKYSILWLGITWPKEKLARRIKQRLEKRFRLGMISEVQKLHRQGLSYKRLESLGLEYRWIAQYLQKKITLSEMKNGLEKAINQYAKRQMTWFKRNKEIHWVTPTTQAIKLVRSFMQ